MGGRRAEIVNGTLVGLHHSLVDCHHLIVFTPLLHCENSTFNSMVTTQDLAQNSLQKAIHEPFETDFGCSDILSVFNVRLPLESLFASEFDQDSLINYVSSVATGPGQLPNVANYLLDIYQTVSKF